MAQAGKSVVQVVQAPASEESQLPADASLFDTLADIARNGELPDAAQDALPQEEFPPAEEGTGPPAIEEEDEDELIEFFQSETWAEIKAQAQENITLANRQARVRDCTKLNVLIIVLDDLGYGDTGAYGQEKIKTPNIDLLAQMGVRYTNYYAGSSVGMASHCSFLTGLHSGHARLRGNSEEACLLSSDLTLAEAMFMAGFDTGMFGNWKMGDAQTTGAPKSQGFQESFGSLNLTHSRDYYPSFLWWNGQRRPILGNQDNGKKHCSLDLITDAAVEFVARGRQRPFFMMVSLAPPSGNLEDAPSLEPYTSEDWPLAQKQYAAMVTRADDAVGRIIDALFRRNLKEKTVVLLTSDNGPRNDVVDPEFFNSNGPFQGCRATLHEGGIRVPMIVCGPSDVIRAAGSVNHHVWWAPDVMPTLLDLVQAWRRPTNIDGVSQLDLWQGRLRGEQQRHFYWELHEDGFVQAVRLGDWKGVREGLEGAVRLFNLKEDPGEENDLAQSNAEVVQQIVRIMQEERQESPDWPVRGQRIAREPE